MKRSSVGGAEALFGAAFLYAMTGILVREVSPMWGDNAQGAARYTVVFVALVVYALLRKQKAHVPRAHVPAAVGLSILFATVVLFFNAAIARTTVANTLFIFYATNMTVSFLWGTFWLHEKVSLAKIAAIILALAGLSVYAHALLAGSLGLLFGVGAGVCDGTSNVLRKRLSGVDRSAVLLVQYAIGTVFTIVVTLLSGQEILRHASLRGSLLTLLFAAVLICGSQLLLYGYQHFDVNIGSVIMSTELIFASVMAFFLFHERPAIHELIGGLLIFAGSVAGSGVLDKRKTAPPDDHAV